jgi:hypothetical protein
MSRKVSQRTAVHAAIAPHINPSTVDNGFCFLGVEAVVDMARDILVGEARVLFGLGSDATPS